MTSRFAVVTAAVLGGLLVGWSPGWAQTPADGPLAAVERLFDAMRVRDTTTMRALLDPAARLFTAETRAGQPTLHAASVDAWLGAVGRATVELDERIWDPRVETDDNLATVWVKYELLVDGKFSHCGVNALQMVRGASGWRILQIADTHRRDNCWHKPA